LKPAEIVSQLRLRDPKVLGDVPDKRVEQILRATFALIRENVSATAEGDVTVATLGRFHAREIVKQEAGEDDKRLKRVIFFPAKPPEKKGPPLLAGLSA